jgi:hypothetical protein
MVRTRRGDRRHLACPRFIMRARGERIMFVNKTQDLIWSQQNGTMQSASDLCEAWPPFKEISRPRISTRACAGAVVERGQSVETSRADRYIISSVYSSSKLFQKLNLAGDSYTVTSGAGADAGTGDEISYSFEGHGRSVAGPVAQAARTSALFPRPALGKRDIFSNFWFCPWLCRYHRCV